MSAQRIVGKPNEYSRFRPGVIVGLTALLSCSAPLSAQLMEYVSQERVVEATLTGSSPASASAPDFGPWVRSISLGASHTSQTSNLLANVISASASSFGQGGTPPPSGTSTGTGKTWLSVVINLPSSRQYSVTGSATGNIGFDAIPSQNFKLLDSGGNSIYSYSHSYGGSPPISSSGTLAAGQYTIFMDCYGVGYSNNSGYPYGMSGGSINFTFTLTPEPGSLILCVVGMGIARRRR